MDGMFMVVMLAIVFGCLSRQDRDTAIEKMSVFVPRCANNFLPWVV